ncbi:hypothetical protein MIR68_002102 [Amoeboaphelidium protococcarum]|nr:hypothetical protein MIR68_002102 [Amoeboaphelidium protococcarum]
MFWGCFSFFGLGPLVALDDNMNADYYLQILEEFVKPEINASKEVHGVDLTFIQDNQCPLSQGDEGHGLFEGAEGRNIGLASSKSGFEPYREPVVHPQKKERQKVWCPHDP